MSYDAEPVSEDIIQWLEAQRRWVGSFYPAEHRHLFDTVDGKLEVLAVILKNKWYQPEDDWKLEALGVALGDALIQQMNMHWVILGDDSGKSLAVELEGNDAAKSIFVHPIGMIEKRLNRDESIDVKELFHGVCDAVKLRVAGS